MDEHRYKYLKKVIGNRCIGGYSNWYIFGETTKDDKMIYTLGIRTHDLGGTDYDHIVRVTKDEAVDFYKGNSFVLPGAYVGQLWVDWNKDEEPFIPEIEK